MTDLITVNVKPTHQPAVKLSVQVPADASVLTVKEQLAGLLSMPADSQRLIYKGSILKDEKTLTEYGIANDHTLHLVRGRPAAQPAATSAAPAVSSSPATASPAAAALPGMPGMSGAGMQEAMQAVMQSPWAQQVMSNPDTMRSLMQSNPMLQQLTQNNPELAQLLNDPSIMRQAMQIAANPGLMRENMRNMDRALSNVESMPGGFQALQRMFTQVQEPLMQATEGMHPLAGLLGGGAAAAATTATASAAQQEGTTNLNSNTPANTTSTSTGATATAGETVPNAAPLPNPWGGGGAQQGALPAGGPGGLTPPGGFGLPGLGALRGMGGIPPDMQQMLQQPGMREMMTSMMSSPGFMDAMLTSNPAMQQMVNSVPGMREMLSNPATLNAMLNPQMLQAFGGLAGGGLQGMPGGGVPGAMPDMAGLASMLQGMGGMGGMGLGMGAPVPAQDPATAFAAQLSALQDMGFVDHAANIRALQASGGNVHAAVERLLSGM